jgi:hypothetical protein
MSNQDHDVTHSKTQLQHAFDAVMASELINSDVHLLTAVLHEIHVGLEIFRPYKARKKVTFFGSARTSPHDPRYIQARNCAHVLARDGFMIITGGGGGIMHAANEGAGFLDSFGININLPMEQRPNPIVDGSPRHFYCKYFFTRKLFFLRESHAVVLCAGGFGTLDEAFETLTLLQTGRNPPLPVVLLEAPGDDYWGPFIGSWIRRLTDDGLISSEDHHFLFHTDSVAAAHSHIRDFYLNYDSFAYLNEMVMLRILKPLSAAALSRLNAEFSDALSQGHIEQFSAEEIPSDNNNHNETLPALCMHLQAHHMNVLPQLIRRMNALYRQDVLKEETARTEG